MSALSIQTILPFTVDNLQITFSDIPRLMRFPYERFFYLFNPTRLHLLENQLNLIKLGLLFAKITPPSFAVEI